MKFLRKFNESELGDELQSLCDDYLSFIKDSGYRVYVNASSINTHVTVSKDSNIYPPEKMDWLAIKDDFIPFINLIKDKFDISYNRVLFIGYEPLINSNYNKGFDINSVVNDEVPDYARFSGVSIQVDGFKK